jgi:hypothetical protein
MGFLNLTGLSQDRDHWRALENKIMKIGFRKMLSNIWATAKLAASQIGLSSIESVIIIFSNYINSLVLVFRLCVFS